jgi:hypothetical protein
VSSSNGVIRVSRKGKKKFAFGDDEPFEVDVVNVFHNWLAIDEDFRSQYDEKEDGSRPIPQRDIWKFHELLVRFVESLRGIDVNAESFKPSITTAEASDFLARLRECYDDLVVFMRPKSREEQDLPGTSEEGSVLRFSEET